MKRSVFLSALGAAGATSPLTAARAAASNGGALFQPAQLVHDLDELWGVMLAVGAYPFATSDRATVAAAYRSIRASLTEPLDAFSFVLKIAPVFGAMNDGHVGVKPGGGFMDALAVPVRCTLEDGKTIVVASADGEVTPGSTLVSIGGVSAERIRDLTLAGWGGQTKRLAIERFASTSRIVTTILAGNPHRYEVRWRDANGETKSAALPRAIVALPWQGGSRWSFRTAPGGRVGIIDYRQCSGLAAFGPFLQNVFTRARDASYRGMIVDIRNNTGGDSRLANELWTYLTAKRFTQFGPVGMRASDFLKRLYGKEKYVEIYGPEAWSAPDGTPITYSQAKIGFVEPEPNALRFRGKVVLLIGPRTFSSALDCAIAAKAYGLATIVGEETSEPVATTGELFEMASRYTNAIGSFTTKYFTPPGGLAGGRGVIPDIDVRTSLSDTLAGRDPVLARALREIG